MTSSKYLSMSAIDISIVDNEMELEKDIHSVIFWSRENRLKFNFGKFLFETKFLLKRES